MSEQTMHRRSPLVECTGVDAPRELNGVLLSESAFFSHINIRADAADAKVMKALGELVGVALPTQPNRCESTARRDAFWLGPDEWLVIDKDSNAQVADELLAAAKENSALTGQHIALTDVSSGQTVIRLSGHNAISALQRGCPFDLHPSNFTPGHCAQTHINHINVLLWPEISSTIDDATEDATIIYNVVVRRSFADYLWRWLCQVQSRLPISD